MAIDIQEELIKTHDKLHCIMCKTMKKTSDFYVSHSNHSMLRIASDSKPREIICKECMQVLFEYFYKLFRSKAKALYRICACLDIYYDEETVERLKDSELTQLVNTYMISLEAKYAGLDKTFVDSIGTEVKRSKVTEPQDEEFTEEDLKNRREVIGIYHYDPFEEEPAALRKKLTLQLCAMCDDSLREDLVRQRAALEIVRSFARIDEWTKTIDTMTKDPKKMTSHGKELKLLIDTKAKETEMITKFSKDHGFAERYALAKSRGSGTIGAIMRDMEDFSYDDGRVNAYDIKTSESIQQASDISFASVVKQLSLSDVEYMDMVKTQRERLVALQSELDRTKEELRLVYKEIKKEELLKELGTELIKKGLKDSEVTQAILSEIHYDDGIIKKVKNEEKNHA